MSAGSGIQHSEFNPDHQKELNLFQIWIFPHKRNVEPRYDQFVMDQNAMEDHFLQLVSPNPDDEGTWIHQQAWIHMAKISQNNSLNYPLKLSSNGVYLMVIEGKVQIGERVLEQKDALGVWDTENIEIHALEPTRILALEVPMVFDLN
jgi:redox-sensitive bicupin YhaK (pirin superfamily)